MAESIGAVDASVAWDGYTLKVEAALYDPQTQSGLLHYSIENPDGLAVTSQGAKQRDLPKET